MTSDPRVQLQTGAPQLGLRLTDAQLETLLAYVALLRKWNRVYNLTSVDEPAETVPRHLLDSLAMVPYIDGPRILDLGTGAGLPGIPLAIVLPQWRWTLLDSSQKKIRFVLQALVELHIANGAAVAMRVQEFSAAEQFSTIITRAVAVIPELLDLAGHLIAPGGRFVFMKASVAEQEIADLPAGFAVREVARLTVPYLAAERHAVVIEKSA